VKITLLSREEMDPLRDFIAEYCQLDPEKKMWAHPQPTRVGAPCAESAQGINSSKTTKNENSCADSGPDSANYSMNEPRIDDLLESPHKSAQASVIDRWLGNGTKA